MNIILIQRNDFNQFSKDIIFNMYIIDIIDE